MHYVTDLHLHSRYSRAVSPQMILPTMAEYALLKGIDVLSASDFTHPAWFEMLKTQLEEAEEGVYMLRNEKGEMRKRRVRFLLSTEISCIYKQNDKVRRVHNLVFVPSLSIAERVNTELAKRGCTLHADGRPIIGLSSRDLLELLLTIDERCLLIPCHVWTPHFGIYGSASGFDSLEEAFGDLTPFVYGIETGLSSDPDMNWQMPELLHRSILSFSDAHSLPKMGREATVFELEAPTYEQIRQAIMRPSIKETKGTEGSFGPPSSIAYTLEFYPEEGKYHFSGHRNCKVTYTSEDVAEKGTMCPVCERRLTEGVFMRVGQLSDPSLCGRVEEQYDDMGIKWYTDAKGLQPQYVKLVPLLEIVAEALGSTVASKKSQQLYLKLCQELASEMHVLLTASREAIATAGGERVAEGVAKVRAGSIAIDPGFDGVYGKVSIWQKPEKLSLA